jgi:hypothetical protein
VPDRADRVHFWVERDGERVVDRPFEPVPEDCDAIHAALGLAIAFALDSTVLGDLGVVPREEPKPTSEQPESGAPAPVSSRRRVALHLQASSAFALHPIAGFGGQMSTSVRLVPALDVRVGAGATTGLREPLADGEVRTTLGYARLDLCAGGEVRRVDLRGCAGALAGFAGVRGFDYSVDSQSFSPWIAALAGASLIVPSDRAVAFVVDADALFPVLKPRIVVNDEVNDEVGAALDLPPVGGMISVGVAFVFR